LALTDHVADGARGEADFEIVAMGAQGDGVTPDGVFIPLTLPGEAVRARRSGDRAELIAVTRPGPARVTPPCPHFGDCGGCALQHWASEPYLDWKCDQVRAALTRVRLETDVSLAFAAPPGSRRRVALHARREGKNVILGFKARRAWRVVPIRVCDIAEPGLVAALPMLRALAAPFLTSPKSAPTLHVTLTASGLDIDVTGVERPGPSADARVRLGAMSAQADIARLTLAGETLYQARQVMLGIGPANVALPPGAFLQASGGAEEAMAGIVVAAAHGARRVADLYCGVGTFAFRLAATAQVLAADSSAPAIAALKSALASAPGLRPITAQARDLDRRPVLAEELKGMDLAVFDPPRAGAAIQSAELGRSGLGRVIAVSCNPATFARDAKILTDAGFRLDWVQVVDQFLWSPHIEVVALFSRT
jgi:23S rRNA (uracil1939-C5)-methyltransferase